MYVCYFILIKEYTNKSSYKIIILNSYDAKKEIQTMVHLKTVVSKQTWRDVVKSGKTLYLLYNFRDKLNEYFGLYIYMCDFFISVSY